MDLKNQ